MTATPNDLILLEDLSGYWLWENGDRIAWTYGGGGRADIYADTRLDDLTDLRITDYLDVRSDELTDVRFIQYSGMRSNIIIRGRETIYNGN